MDLPAALGHILRPGQRGVIMAGAQCPIGPEAVAVLAQQTQFPVIADTISCARRSDTPNLIAHADIITASDLAPEGCEFILRLGDAPLARSTYEWASNCGATILRITRQTVIKDFLHERFTNVIDPTPAVLHEIGELLATAPSDWTQQWRAANDSAHKRHSESLAAFSWSELLACHIIAEHHQHQYVVLGNSLPVREFNRRLAHADQPMFANRGVNGIDGQLASALGYALHMRGRGLVVLGDVSSVHDIGGLAAIGRHQANLTILILDNGGGRIFDVVAKNAGTSSTPGYAPHQTVTGKPSPPAATVITSAPTIQKPYKTP